ncbi:MAG: heme exporter protein CcmB [Archangiaceae bacterium]|nr:heme exporter protein CcmB [Archangiaceae bacterium]
MTPAETVAQAPAVTTARPVRPGLFACTVILLRKDLLLEWRTRARLNALVFFGICTLLMFSFALGANAMALREHASGYFWLAILFASVLSLSESFRVEQENHSLDGLRLAPANGRAIFLAKAIGNTVLLWGLGAVLAPLSIAVFDLRVVMSLFTLAFIMLVGSMAISAAGTFYASIASNARARDVLLPILLFPVLVPVLIAAVKATTMVFEGDPMNQMESWLTLLGSLNVIYWGLGLVLFPRIIEDL